MLKSAEGNVGNLGSEVKVYKQNVSEIKSIKEVVNN